MRLIEEMKIQPKGSINIQLIKDGKILNEYEDHNTIVNMASSFMAARMAPDSERVTALNVDNADSIEEARAKTLDTSGTYPLNNGFQYIAIGDGKVNDYHTAEEKALYIMNASTNPAHTLDQLLLRTSLYDEYYRGEISQWYFVGEDDYPSVQPTGKIRLSTLIKSTASAHDGASLEGKYICELGIFGGTSTSAKDSGYMFNIKIIDGWKIIPESQLLVNWTITF